MLIAFVLVLLVIGSGILLSMYSVFIPFFESIKNVTEYNIAYYGAISAIERGLLVSKYQNPGFVGSGGWNLQGNYGPLSDNKIDTLGRLSNNNTSLGRSIDSRTKQIPSTGNSNIPYFLASSDSYLYNQLGYKTLERFLLGIDNTSDPNYFYDIESDPLISYFDGDNITIQLRLPPKVYSGLGANDGALLCDQEGRPNNCDKNQDGLIDETIVLWSILGKYDSPSADYTILPTTNILRYKTPPQVDEGHDNNLRESDINDIQSNQGNILEFNNSSQYDPVTTHPINLLTQHNVISTIDETIQTQLFNQLFKDSSNVEIQLSLSSLLDTRNGNIYPFLEYRLTSDQDIADRFYNIQASSQVGQYNVKINIQKPTSKSDNIGTFTIIF